jgi:hypothetical protein
MNGLLACHTSVMVVYKCYRPAGPPADEPRCLALRINQPPELTALDRLLQHALCHKVKRGAAALRSVDPVAQPLPRRILGWCEQTCGALVDLCAPQRIHTDRYMLGRVARQVHIVRYRRQPNWVAVALLNKQESE